MSHSLVTNECGDMRFPAGFLSCKQLNSSCWLKGWFVVVQSCELRINVKTVFNNKFLHTFLICVYSFLLIKYRGLAAD